MAGIEVVFVTTGRNQTPKRRAIVIEPGRPLPRIGESVIVDFGEGKPSRWIVQDVTHVVDGEQPGIVLRVAAPYTP